MTTDDRRAALLAARTVNGVDFVEVDSASETTLVVHFIFNLPGSPAAEQPVPADPAKALGKDDFQVIGGERITGITVLTAAPRPGTYDQMNVVVDRAGDFSVYTLSLNTLPGSPPGTPAGTPAGFDPASVSADFLFHIECAGDFDCAVVTECPPDVPAPPPIDYLARDYPGFRRVMLDRLSLLAPGWAERNPADLGVALVELLAYAGDHLSYREDVVATEAYLGTARLRTSARRHARLVDYPIGEGANARAWLRVMLHDSTADGSVLPAGTRCATRFPGSPDALEHATLAYRQAIDAGAVFFETVTVPAPDREHETVPPLPTATTLYWAHSEMALYAWSETRLCLAPGTTHATLSGHFPNLVPGMILVLAEAKGPSTGDPADADPRHRQAVRLERVVVADDPMSSQPVTEIDWHAEDALTFALCVSSISDATHGEQPVQGVAVAWGNIVLADQGRSIGVTAGVGVKGLPAVNDPLSTGPETVGVVPTNGRFRPALASTSLTFAVEVPDPSSPALAWTRPAGAPTAAVTLTSQYAGPSASVPTIWSVTEDLLDIGIGAEPVFIPEIETDGTAHLLFGDGVNGLLPVAGTTFQAVYRVGNGSSGNVARDAICLLDRTGVPSGVVGISNPLPACGGVDPETVEHVRQSAPASFRKVQKRAVTTDDYTNLVMAHPGVRRAAATLRWTGSWYTVFITVERDMKQALGPDFVRDLEAYLDGYRMAGFDLEVQEGISVPLLLRMSVCVRPGSIAADVRRALLAIFTAGAQPDGSPGMFNPGRLDLGQPFYLSPLIAAAQGVDGVASVEVTAFERQATPDDSGLVTGVLVPDRLELFVLDNDPNFPERGHFELAVEGGL